MIGEEHKERVKAAVRAGRYSLLLGAGFSAKSVGPTGVELPDGETLAADLAREAGYSRHPLPQLTLAIEPAQLAGMLVRRFKGCRASPGVKLVSRFVWQHIFTFNVDDVLRDCYSEAEGSKQRLRYATYRDNYFRPDDLRELPAIFLHGSVHAPEHGFVFSAEEYGASIAEESRWFKILADAIAASPMIVVGAGLNEPDLFYYLKRRNGLTPAHSIAPSLYVSRTIDEIKLKLCNKFGLVPVQATADDFFKQLLAEVGEPPSPLQLLLPARADLFPIAPPDATQRVFFRQWLLVEPGSLPRMLDEAVPEPHLLSGVEPRWTQIERGDDITRQVVGSLVQDVDTWKAKADKGLEVRLLVSTPGEGKTTILMRMAYELAKSGVSVFFYNTYERIAVRDTVVAVEAMARPCVLVLDHLGDHGTQFEDLIEQVRAKSLPCFVVSAERQLRMRRVADVVPLEYIRQLPLSKLSKTESEALVGRMRDAGLLGKNAGRSNSELVPRVSGRELFTGVVLLNAAAKQLGSVVSEELKDLTEGAKRLYAAAALAHSCEYPIRTSILIRASGLDASQAFKAIGSELKGLLRPLPPLGDFYETRHSIIAEEVVRQLSQEQLFQVFVSVARSLAPYVNTKTYSRGTEEARLAARLLDFDATVRPLLGRLAEAAYSEIKNHWAWNNRYWTQLALLKLPTDPLLALQYADQAVGIESHYVALTTRAKVLFRLARTHSGSSHGEKYLFDALETVDESLRRGRGVRRANLQTLDVAIRGVIDYHESGPSVGTAPDSAVATKIKEYLREAKDLFLGAEQRALVTRWAALQSPNRATAAARPRAARRQRRWRR